MSIDPVVQLVLRQISNGVKLSAPEMRLQLSDQFRKHHGRDPNRNELELAIASLKRTLRNLKSDNQQLASLRENADKSEKATGTGGGKRVIRKPGIFGG